MSDHKLGYAVSNKDGTARGARIDRASATLLEDFAGVLDRQGDAVKPHSSSAQHATGDGTREAYELWSLGYTDDDQWVCADCEAEMTPYCWKWSNELRAFLTKAGVPARQPPHFRAESGHKPGCEVSFHSKPHDHVPPEYRLGVPTDYPAWVKLSREPPRQRRPRQEEWEDATLPDDPDLRRPRPTYGIGEVCEYYADHLDEHWKRLRVESCPGATYDECFVRLGTGNHKGVGRNWIFFDQLWLGGYINLKAEPLVLPLLTTVYGEPRRLLVRTSEWPNGFRRAFEDRLLEAIIEARKAIRERGPHRAWIFFYGRETDFNQIEFDVAFEPGVDVLVRHLPQHWNLRPGNAYRAKRRPLISDAVSPEPDAPLHHAGDELGTSSELVVDEVPVSTGLDAMLPSKPPADDAAEAGSPAVDSGPEEIHPVNEETGSLERDGAGEKGEAAPDSEFPPPAMGTTIVPSTSSPSEVADVYESVMPPLEVELAEQPIETPPTVDDITVSLDQSIKDDPETPSKITGTDDDVRVELVQNGRQKPIHAATPDTGAADQGMGERPIKVAHPVVRSPSSANSSMPKRIWRVLAKLTSRWRL